MKIFLTGATGYIGGRLLRALQKLDDVEEIRCLVREPSRFKNKDLSKIKLFKGDITNRSSMTGPIQGVDRVFHLAAYYELGIAKNEIPNMEQVNIVGTKNVLSLAQEFRIPKVVYVSTVYALGDTGSETATEDFEHKLKFTCHYERTKYEAHKVAKQFATEGLPIVTVLPAAVYGEEDPSVIGKTIKLISSGRSPFVICGTETNRLTLVHVDDVVQLILLASNKGKIGESYIAAGDVMTNQEMSRVISQIGGVRPPWIKIPVGVAQVLATMDETISRMRGQKPLLSHEALNTLKANFAVSSQKSRKELGFSPRSNIEGLKQTISWIKQ